MRAMNTPQHIEEAAREALYAWLLELYLAMADANLDEAKKYV